MSAEDYMIAFNVNASVLVKDVKRLISEGWQPLGGLSTTLAYSDMNGQLTNEGQGKPIIQYAQALIKPLKIKLI